VEAMQKKKVLIFSPFAYIWVHALPEIQLGRILERNGFSVSLLGCSEDFQQYCTSMSAAGLEMSDSGSDKQKICDYCLKLRRYSEGIPKINFLKSSVMTRNETDYAIPDSLEGKIGLKLEGIEIGKIALYETLIKYKKVDTNLSNVESLHYEACLQNAIKSYSIAIQTLNKEKPDIVICYSPQYVIPGTFAAVAKSLQIPVIFAEGSSIDVERYSHLRLWDWEEYGLSQPALSNSDLFERYTPTKKSLKRAKKQLSAKTSMTTFSVYSTASRGLNPFEFFGLDQRKKVYLMAMSSYDEVFSGYMINKLPKERFEGLVFKDQVAWLEATVQWFSKHPELQLIVRPHPREFPNKRESHPSNHREAWDRVLENLPPNVRLDHPSLKFSLFDHLNSVDVVITGWSSTGVEALAKGIPVITYDKNLPTFSPLIHLSGTTREEYFDNLLLAEKFVRSNLNRDNAIRWLAYTADVGTVKVGGRITDRLGLPHHWKISRIINSRYLSFAVKRIELRIPPSHSGDRKIVGLINGKVKSLFSSSELC